jgi:hypothetical protein
MTMRTVVKENNRTMENHEMQMPDPLAGASRKALKFLPLYMLVPVMFWALFHSTGYELNWKGFGLGALGWFVALFLRGPLSLLVQKWPPEKAKNVIVGSSGVLEEGVRLILIALTSTSFSWAQSVGQGWAAVEVVFVIVNVIMISTLVNRTDEKAMQAKELLKAQGNIQASPLWGILERIWASSFHIGATLMVAFNPWLVLIVIPLHSGLNLVAVRLAASASLVITNLFIAAVGLITLAVSLVMY